MSSKGIRWYSRAVSFHGREMIAVSFVRDCGAVGEIKIMHNAADGTVILKGIQISRCFSTVDPAAQLIMDAL